MGKVVEDICPAAPGAKDWQPSAFSPRTGLLYMPHNNLCMDYESVEVNYIAGTPYVGANVKMYAGPRRQPRRVQRVGSGRRARRCGASRSGSRCGAARSSRRATSSSTGRWTGGSRRWTRGPASVLWQFKRARDHRPADHVPRAGRQAVRRDPLGRRRLGGRDRRRASSTRATPPRRSGSRTR